MQGERESVRMRVAAALCAPALAIAMVACSGTPRGDCVADPAPGEVGTLCGVVNPEDVEVVPSASVILVSSMRFGPSDGGGAILALSLDEAVAGRPLVRRLWPASDGAAGAGAAAAGDPLGDPSCTEPPPADGFSPHGLTAMATGGDGMTRVAVVGHFAREAVELFDLEGDGPGAQLRWRGCVPMPPEVVGNDVDFRADGSLVVSNYQPTMSGGWALYYMMKGAVGMDTGDVLAWTPTQGWRHIAGTAARNPNGVLVAADERHVFYAETGSGKIVRALIDGPAPAGGFPSVDIGGNPDNLSWGASGKVLAATHTDGPAITSCMLGFLPCRAAWSLYEIDPHSMQATEVVSHDGSRIGGVASASLYNGTYFVGAIFGDRIGFVRP